MVTKQKLYLCLGSICQHHRAHWERLHGPVASSPFSAGEEALKDASLLRSAESQEQISHSLSTDEFGQMMNYLLDTLVVHYATA